MSRPLLPSPTVSLNYGPTADPGWGINGVYTGTPGETITISEGQAGDTIFGTTSGVNVIINALTGDDGTPGISGKGWTIGDSNNPTTVTVNGSLRLTNADTITGDGISANSSKVVVGDGGTLILSGYSNTTPGLVQFGEGHGTIEIAAGTTTTILQFITNIKAGDTIILDGTIADGYTYGPDGDHGVYTLTSNGIPVTNSSAFQLPQLNEGSTFTVTTVGGKTYLNAVAVVTCFLTGSMIRTPGADKPVEEITIGDEIVTFDWKANKDVIRPVTWIGKARALVNPNWADDAAGWPVRVLKNAIAEGVPYKDMLITPEHCLFFREKFVPARMLVNGISIFYDKSVLSYDYYHLETAEHSVITADGMLTESYLDTGNRSTFQQPGKIATLGGAEKSWEHGAAAPLEVAQSFVEPLFHELKWRGSRVTDTPYAQTTTETTSDPALHLVTENGATIRPVRRTDNQYMFMIPTGTKTVRLVSHASRPCDSIGPFVDDRRTLGVAVSDVQLLSAKCQHDITTHLQAEKPEGWYNTDQTDHAWTNGNAILPLEESLTQGNIGLLSVTLVAAGPYVVTAQQTSATTARSA